MAQDAGTDIFFLIVHKFGDPSGIRQKLSGKTGTVEFPLSDLFRCRFRVHPSCTDDRNIAILADVFDILQVAVFRHIDRWMCPVPCVIGSVIAIQHIVSRFLQKLHGDFGFFHIPADFRIVFTR